MKVLRIRSIMLNTMHAICLAVLVAGEPSARACERLVVASAWQLSRIDELTTRLDVARRVVRQARGTQKRCGKVELHGSVWESFEEHLDMAEGALEGLEGDASHLHAINAVRLCRPKVDLEPQARVIRGEECSRRFAASWNRSRCVETTTVDNGEWFAWHQAVCGEPKGRWRNPVVCSVGVDEIKRLDCEFCPGGPKRCAAANARAERIQAARDAREAREAMQRVLPPMPTRNPESLAVGEPPTGPAPSNPAQPPQLSLPVTTAAPVGDDPFATPSGTTPRPARSAEGEDPFAPTARSSPRPRPPAEGDDPFAK